MPSLEAFQTDKALAEVALSSRFPGIGLGVCTAMLISQLTITASAVSSLVTLEV